VFKAGFNLFKIMRVFKDNDIKAKMAKEMFNIETGMLHYDFTSEKKKEKPTLYPSILVDGIKTTIRSAIGFIYLPNDMDLGEFITGVETHLTDYDANYNHLSKYARLERPAGHFTSMKAKNTMTITKHATPQTGNDNNWRRSFIINTEILHIGSQMHTSRFYWYVFPMKVMIKNIEQFHTPRFPPTTQFVSIIYDKFDHLSVGDCAKLESNVTFQHFRVCKNLVSFKPLQRIVEKEIAIPKKVEEELDMTDEEKQAYIDLNQCPKCRKKFKSKGGLTRHTNQNTCTLYVAPMVVTNSQGPDYVIADLTTPVVEAIKYPCIHCKKEFRTTGSLKTHLHKCKAATAATLSLAKAETLKDNMEKFLSMSAEEKKEHLEKMGGHPEYMPQWNDIAQDPKHSLALCPKRSGSLELIHYFGKWDIYKDSADENYIPIIPIPVTIYNENFHNVIIDPSLAPKSIPKTRKKLFPKTADYSNSEICSSCYTPLYDDIYIVIAKETDIEGYAVCGTCMHYSPEKKKIVLRVSYPTNVSSVIDKTDFIKLKKDILKKAFKTNFVDHSSGYNTAMYIGYDPKEPKQYDYIGWSGCLAELISYMSTDNNYYASGDSKVLSNWSEHAKIFQKIY